MPSFVIHTICGKELLKKLKLSHEDEMIFYYGNLLPDHKNLNINPEWNDVEYRNYVQSEKNITHFRNITNETIEYPNMDLFLSKYKHYVKKDLITFAYFFHLYTDYYFLLNYLSKDVVFYDKDMHETKNKYDNYYTKILKNNNIILTDNFLGHKYKNSLYKEYDIISTYLIKKYHLKIDFKELKDFIQNNNFNIIIKEINNVHKMREIKQLEKLYNLAINSNNVKFNIFTKDEINHFVENCVNSFIEIYSKLLYKSN